MKVTEALERISARCEAEAVAHGFPPELGSILYSGQMQDDLEGWTDEQYISWCYSVDGRFGKNWLPVYREVAKIMGEFATYVD